MSRPSELRTLDRLGNVQRMVRISPLVLACAFAAFTHRDAGDVVALVRGPGGLKLGRHRQASTLVPIAHVWRQRRVEWACQRAEARPVASEVIVLPRIVRVRGGRPTDAVGRHCGDDELNIEMLLGHRCWCF